MNDSESKTLFWGCFIALITTAFGFIARMFLIPTWAEEFSLDPAQAGRLAGIGIWPFAVSIIGFSLFIDRIGYKKAMYVAFGGHIIWAIMAVSAFFVSKGGNPAAAFQMIYWGSLILALGNGTVEAFINPVVATMFSKEKTKWLNILHAGWPGGLVLAGLLTIFMDSVPWSVKVGIIALPAIVYFVMLMKVQFPKSERETAGVSYKEMLQEFGILGAGVVAILVVLQLMDFFSAGSTIALPGWQKAFFVLIGVGIVAGFGFYTRTLGRGLLFVLILIMMPLATTEIGTDGWITGIMEGALENIHPGWVLVYTSGLMLVLRFYAGPIVHRLSPLGLLAASAILAILGLLFLAGVNPANLFLLFVAATLYGVGKTFFWPTMLGVVSEQTPKGGALTLNAIAGIGMLAVGTLGFPYIGVLQTQSQQKALVNNEEVAEAVPGLIEDGKVTALTDKTIYEVMSYQVIDEEKLSELKSNLPESEREAAVELVAEVRAKSNQGALGAMAIFPTIMLAAYIGLIFFFRSRGGYKPVTLTAEQMSGGVEGPVR